MSIDYELDSEGTMTFRNSPSLISIYLPGGEVHNLRGVSRVSILASHLLKFTDREGAEVFTSNHFTLSFKPINTEETPDA